MTFIKVLLSFQGRIARSTFWWSLLSVLAVFAVLLVFLRTQVSAPAGLVLYPPVAWILAALFVKRLRDRGKSPGWLAVALIPVIGPLWLFIELGLRRGTEGENQYGPDPLTVGIDYLTVNIGRP